VTALPATGCEIAAHGRTNAERQGQLPEAEERKLIAVPQEVSASIQQLEAG
jgi:hypothetical protein